MASLLERFARSPLARQFEADEVAAVVDQRRAAVAELGRIESERNQTLAPLMTSEAAATDRVAKAQLALTTAQNQLGDAARARYAENLRLDTLATQQRVILRTTTPEPITAWRVEILARERAAQRSHIGTHDPATPGTALPDWDGRRAQILADEAEAVRRLRAYLTALRDQRTVLEELVYVDLSPDALAAKLTAMRSEVDELALAARMPYLPGQED
jgi:hypothetical protein